MASRHRGGPGAPPRVGVRLNQLTKGREASLTIEQRIALREFLALQPKPKKPAPGFPFAVDSEK